MGTIWGDSSCSHYRFNSSEKHFLEPCLLVNWASPWALGFLLRLRGPPTLGEPAGTCRAAAGPGLPVSPLPPPPTSLPGFLPCDQ